MSEFTVGRVGLDVVLSEIDEWSASGDQVQLSGSLQADTLSDVKALRQQLLGYLENPDEEVVPVTWSEDPSVDGFYRVRGASVSTVPASLSAFWFEFSLTLERVPSFAAPLTESVLVGALRTNVHFIGSGTSQPWHAYPSSARGYDPAAPSTPIAARLTRASVDGNLNWDLVTSPAGHYYDAKPRMYLAPADWYIGAAKIEVGSTLRTVVGQQIDPLPENWRLSNGLVRVTPVSGSQNIDVSHYDGSTWETAKRYKIEPASTITGAPHTVNVLRNGPEECIIRLGYQITLTAALTFAVNVDLGLRRGSRTVTVVVTSNNATPFGIARATAEAATQLTGGIRATANDAGGNRYLLTSPHTITTDLVNGKITYSGGVGSTDLFMAAIGMEVGGSSAVTYETAQDQIYQYHAAQSERITVVGA